MKKIAELALITLQTWGYRLLTRGERAVLFWHGHAGWVKNQILITAAVAIVVVGLMLTFQAIADSRVNWMETTCGELEICDGLTVTVIHLK